MPDGIGREFAYLSSHATNRYFIPNWGINTIKECCCWSIWFTVFKDHPEVRKELIDKFPGTAKDCFDPNNGYEPIACVSHPV